MSQSVSGPTIPTTPAQYLDLEACVIGNARVSDDELLKLATRSDLTIREVRAPLSLVTVATLHLFLKTHGHNLESFNLQNNRMSGEDFVSLATMMPELKTLSFQYLHTVNNEDLLKIIQTCKNLESLIISRNGRISKQAYYQILELDRHFSVLSLDINGPAPKEVHNEEVTVRAQVENLRLAGLPFGNNDVINVTAIKGLKTVEFVHTSVQPEAIAKLYTPDSLPSILITSFSEKKANTFKGFFRDQNIPFEAQGKKIKTSQKR